jgi:hypothetical protein
MLQNAAEPASVGMLLGRRQDQRPFDAEPARLVSRARQGTFTEDHAVGQSLVGKRGLWRRRIRRAIEWSDRFVGEKAQRFLSL